MSDLCCCEYYDADGERNHILAACCNCYHLDESFERLITCKPIPLHLKHSLAMTIKDRLRIPWYGGAKQVSMILPFFYVPALIILASLNLICTVIAIMIGIVMFWVASKSAMMLPKFFMLWMVASVGMIVLVFEVLVVPWLLILRSENLLIIVLLVIAIACIVKIHFNVWRLQEGISSEKNSYYCQFCQIYRTGGTVHRYWIDSCVTTSTFRLYMIATITTASSLLYLANLNLTTICHPFRPFKTYTFLLPDDCTEVYEAYAVSLPFVTAVYATIIGALLLFEFLVNLLGNPCYGCCLLLKVIFLPFYCCYRLIICFRTGTKSSPKIIV